MRILLVEDEVKVAAFVRQALEEAGHAVDVRSDSAVTEVAGYDLLILDWMLPGGSGLDVCGAVRRAGDRTPILMLTARDAVADRIAGLDEGADDYLTKPFALGELLARVRALLRRGDAPVLRVEDLVLDPQRRQVTRAGREIPLSAREYSLLEFLMRNTGRVVTRATIAEHVWNEDFDSGTNVVDVYVSYLRHKMDHGFSPRLLHTVRGSGYRLGT